MKYQKVHSSGISSGTTQRIADKALGNMPSVKSLHVAGKAGGLMGAACAVGYVVSEAFNWLLD